MSRSLTIARVHEIDIRLHPTFALVFVWVLLDWRRLSNGQGALAVLFTLILVLLVFGCVLLHEFGHAFMAREHGVRVHDVSLSAVGGVARMDQLPADPRSEVLIALAGPAVNLAFSVALMPIALLVGVLSGFSSLHDYALTVFAPSLPGLITTLLYANLLLVAFNILPAFPMDGGRVFRAGMTAIIGREAGTRVAVVVGQLFAAVLLLVSIFVVQSAIMALLAVFIFVVAYAEGRAVRVESALRRMRVGQFALWDMGGIAPSQPIANALRGGPRDVAVTEDGRVIGMLWRNRLLAQLGTSQAGIVVGDVMDRDVLSVDVDDTVYDVHQLMTERQRWAVPVTESGTYRGIFTNDRLLHIYRQLAPDPIRVLRNFISQSPFERLRT